MSFPFGAPHFADAEPVSPAIAAYLGKIALSNRPVSKRPVLHIDYETWSEAELPKTGASRYARDPSTEILMLAYGWSDGEVKQWVPVLGEPMPDDLKAALRDPSVTLAAWNAPFEMAITEHVLGMDVPKERWLDVMALAYSLSLPGKLSKCGEVIGLPEDKKKLARGTALVRRFCMPRKPTKNKPWVRCTHSTDPEEWLEFLEYNRQDVEAERAIYRRIKRFQMPDHEWKLWHLDQKINDAGIPINLDAVKAAVALAEATIAKDLAEMKRLTGLANPNSNLQILPWLRAHGYQFLDLKKGHIERATQATEERIAAIETTLPTFPAPLQTYIRETVLAPARLLSRVLELRLRVSKASVKKYPALLAATDDDGMLRGCHQFAGAGRTWRWSGRRFQPQNLPKPSKGMEKFIIDMAPTHNEAGEKLDATERAKIGYALLCGDIEHLSVAEFWAKYERADLPGVNTMEALTAAVRPMVQGGDTRLLVDADLSAIENVALGWLARDDKILRVFRNGLDPYIDFATDMFNLPYDEIARRTDAGDKSMRTTAKPGVLGCLKGETPVLTHRGWKALVELRADDWLHDGTKWVRHEGVVFKGYQEVALRSGLYATPDHKFLAGAEWLEWQQVSQRQTFEKALDTGNGVFSPMQGHHAAAERSIFAGANVVENESYRDQTSCADYPPVAPAALRLTVAPTSENESAQTFSTPSQIVSTLRERVAKTRKTVPTITTEVGEFVCGSRTPSRGSNTSWTSSGLTAPLKSTGSTTTEITRREIFDLPLGRNKTEIADTWDILNTGDFARFAVLTEDGCLVAHNCGYMLGAGEQRENRQTGEIEATGLLGYAWAMYVPLTPAMAKLSVDTFRAKFKDVVAFWYDLDRAVRRVIRTRKPETVGYLTIDFKKPFLRIRLPSGRYLHYMRPRIENRKMPWGDIKPQITYENLENGQWRRVTTHPGKLTENVTQAVARDILAHGMTLADAEGIDIRMHVHDQIVGLSPESRAADDLRALIRCMTTRPPWADDKLPLKAAGLTTPVFIKD